MAFDRNNQADVQKLAAELAKPEYATHRQSGNDAAIVLMLNDPTKRDLPRTQPVDRSEIYDAITAANFGSLTAANADKLAQLLMSSQIKFTQKMFDKLATIFPASGGTVATNTALNGLLSRKGSIFEELFGEGSVATTTDVAVALGRG